MGYEAEKMVDAQDCGCYTVTREHDFWSSWQEHQVVCKMHQDAARQQQRELQQKKQDHFTALDAVATVQYVPIQAAIQKYRKVFGNQNSDKWVRQWLLNQYKCLDFMRENRRYFCSNEKLDFIDFLLV